MPVFRVEKNKDYTVMANFHLRDKSLSLKAKGLLSQMLSLPEDWDYTLSGLCHINRESKDATAPRNAGTLRPAVHSWVGEEHRPSSPLCCDSPRFSTDDKVQYQAVHPHRAGIGYRSPWLPPMTTV